ncbi:MAG: peptide ABC transporter substrate-binding protein [Bdellovibrionota bacterium]
MNQIYKLAIVGLLGCSIVACTKKQETQTATTNTLDQGQYYGTTEPKHGIDEIWINNREEPQYMDPILTHGVPDGALAMNAFARLVQIDPHTAKAAPDLAEKWDVYDEGRRYVFTLREGLKWSDGQPLTAHDFDFAWRRLMDPATGAVYASLAYTTIEGGEAFARKALVVSGFSAAVEAADLQAFLEGQGLSIEKVVARYQSTDHFVFPGGDDKAKSKKAIENAIHKSNKFGKLSAKEADGSVVAMRAIDDTHFEVTLVGPLPYFVLLAEFSNFAALPQHVVERVAKENNGDASSWTKLENIVCSGAYKLVKENFKIDKIYEKNPYYWDAANVKTNRIRILMIESENTLMNAYKVGEVDVYGPHQISAEQLGLVKGMKDFHQDPYLGIYYYLVNHKVPGLDNVKVRKALSLAIDRQSLATNVLGDSFFPYGGIVPDGLAGYKSYQQELFNPEKARQLLAEAGYPNGEGFPNFQFLYDTKEIHRTVIQAVQQMWKKELNIDVELVNTEWKVYLHRMQTHNFELGRQGWIGDFIDPFTFHELALSNSGNNHSQWKSATYDELVLGANKEPDQNKRLEMLHEAEKIAIQEQAMIPLLLYTKTYMHKPYVKGFYKDYQDHHLWKHMWIDPNWNK